VRRSIFQLIGINLRANAIDAELGEGKEGIEIDRALDGCARFEFERIEVVVRDCAARSDLWTGGDLKPEPLASPSRNIRSRPERFVTPTVARIGS
jgi:hypothetical protein